MINLRHIPKEEIDQKWSDISLVLEPAIRISPTHTVNAVYAGLISGRDVMMEVLGDASGVIVFEVVPDGVLWTKFVAGSVKGGPKERLANMRAMLTHIETMAIASGCTAHMVCGRDWSVVLDGYELTNDGYRKSFPKMEAA